MYVLASARAGEREGKESGFGTDGCAGERVRHGEYYVLDAHRYQVHVHTFRVQGNFWIGYRLSFLRRSSPESKIIQVTYKVQHTGKW